MIDVYTAKTSREYVQRGLALRVIKRREEEARAAEIRREAAQQAAERSLHEDINFHSKWVKTETRAAQVTQSHDKQARDERAARREQDALRNAQWRTYLKRNATAVGIAGALHVLHAIGGVSLWLAVSGMILCGLYTIINCVSYDTRNRKGE